MPVLSSGLANEPCHRGEVVSETSRKTIPALKNDRRPLSDRSRFDFTDYGFVVRNSLSDTFEIVPITVDDSEAFLFFYPKVDLGSSRFSLLNLHCSLKYVGSVDDFAHSRGASVANVELSETQCMGTHARYYRRQIAMKDLFQGAPQVIDFIGGAPDLIVVDMHTYFMHRHAHFYSGLIHEPYNDNNYLELRQHLFDGISLV
jgi:hypothetical protein